MKYGNNFKTYKVFEDLIGLFPLLIFTLISTISYSQKRVDFQKDFKAEITQYQVLDVIFNVKKVENPLETTFGANFKDIDGKSTSIEGFYDDNNQFILRFSASKIGIYSFETYSSNPELSGLKGQINSTKNTNPNQHGGLTVSKLNPQKLAYEDSTSCFALAFECDWLFALDYDNKTDIPKTKTLIQTIKNNGFNQVVMNVYAYDVGWKIDEKTPKEYLYSRPNYSVFEGTNEKPDFEKLNLNFFKQFDRVINELNQNGINAHVMIYVWNKKVNWPSMYSKADNQYFDYVIKRYQAFPNMIWDISKEALDYGRCDIPYINERISRIRQKDAFKRLITVHDYEYCSREPDKIDIISIQNWRNDLYSLSLEALQKHPNKPVMNIEHGGYEKAPYFSFAGNYTNPETCIIRNYENVFAGLYSCYYWQNTSWNILIHNPLDPKHTFEKPRFDYYKILQGFFNKYDFSKLNPYKPKLTTNGRFGKDNFSSSGYPLTDDNGLYLYLVPASNDQINVVIPKPKTGKLEVEWFNIFTGEYKKSDNADWWNWRGFESPWKGQTSVLILKSI
jgi:hypothetical protein